MLNVAPRGNGAVTPLVVQAEVLPGNGLLSTLANSITASATTLNIQAGDAVNWPAGGIYRAVLCQDPLNGPFELVMVTGGQGSSTLQVTRAAESYNGNTTAYAWPVGTSISAVLTQAGLNAMLGSGGAGGTDVASYFRSTAPGTLPTTGVGTEMFYQGTVQPTSAYTGTFFPSNYDPYTVNTAVSVGSDTNIGISFSVDVACTLQAITYFRSETQSVDRGPTQHNFGLYRVDTQALLWQGWSSAEVDYWNPIPVGYTLQPGVTYMAVVHLPAGSTYQRDASFLSAASGNIPVTPVPMHYVSSSTGAYASLAFPGTVLGTPDGLGLDVLISGTPASANFQAFGAWFNPNQSGYHDYSEGGVGANGGYAFTVNQPCTLTQVRWWRSPSDTAATARPIGVFDRRTGLALWTGTTTAEVASQWNTVNTPAIALQPNVPYMLGWHLFATSYYRDYWNGGFPLERGPLHLEASYINDNQSALVCPTNYFGTDFIGADLVVSVATQTRAVVQTYDHAANAAGPLEIDASTLLLNAQSVVAPNGLQIGTFSQPQQLVFAGPNPDVRQNELPSMTYALGVGQDRVSGGYLYVRTAGIGGVYTDWSTLAVIGWTNGVSGDYRGSGGRLVLSANGDISYGAGMTLDSSGAVKLTSSPTSGNRGQFNIAVDSTTLFINYWFSDGTTYVALPAFVNLGYYGYENAALAIGNTGLVQNSLSRPNAAYGVYAKVGPTSSQSYANADISLFYGQIVTNSPSAVRGAAYRGLMIDTPSWYSGTTWSNSYGVYIANQAGAAGVTQGTLAGIYVAQQQGGNSAIASYGLYLEAESTVGYGIALYNAGASRFDGTVSIGFDPQNGVGLTVMGTWLTGGTNYGIWNQPTFGGSADGFGMYVQTNWQAGTSSYQTGGIKIDYPSMNGGSIYNSYGIYIGNPGGTGGITNAYGIYVNSVANASTINIGIYNGATTRFDAAVAMGANPVPYLAFDIDSGFVLTGGSVAWGIQVFPTVNTGTSYYYGVSSGITTKAASYTLTSAADYQTLNPTLGAGSSITTHYGFLVGNCGKAGITVAYGIYINAQSGASSTNIGFYNLASSRFDGCIGLGLNPVTYNGVYMNTNLAGNSNQAGFMLFPVFGSDALSSGADIAINFRTSGSFTMPTGYGVWVQGPNLFGGSSVTTLYGVYVANQGIAGITNAYGLYIATQSGASSTNIGLYNGGTSQLQGNIGIGGVSNASFCVYLQTATLTGPSQYGFYANPTFSSAASSGVIYYAFVRTDPSYTLANAYGLLVGAPTVGTSGAITTIYAINIANQGKAGITSVYGIYINAQSGQSGNAYGIYNNANFQQYGNVGIGLGVGTQTIVAIGGAYMSSIYQTGLSVTGQFSSGCTGYGVGVEAYAYSVAATFTIPIVYVYRADIPQLGSGCSVTSIYGFYAGNQGAAAIASAYGILAAAQSGSTTRNISLYLGTSSGTGAQIIGSDVGASLTTAGAWTNAPSWAAQKNAISPVQQPELDGWYDWLTATHKPVRYRHPEIRNDDGEVTIVTPEGDYDHFGFLLDDVPQDIREVWCVNESGGLSTKDTEGFLLAMLKVSGQRIKTLEARLEALESRP